MEKDTKQLTTGSQLLMLLLDAKTLYAKSQSRGRLSTALYPEYVAYKAERNTQRQIQRLKQKGWIRYEYKNSKQIIKLTSKGQLEALLAKSMANTESRSDQNWTLATFDIPEHARAIRKKLRLLLYAYGFRALQASAYVSPKAPSSAGLEYLKTSKLIKYIQIFRIEKTKETANLAKLFHAASTMDRPVHS